MESFVHDPCGDDLRHEMNVAAGLGAASGGSAADAATGAMLMMRNGKTVNVIVLFIRENGRTMLSGRTIDIYAPEFRSDARGRCLRTEQRGKLAIFVQKRCRISSSDND